MSIFKNLFSGRDKNNKEDSIGESEIIQETTENMNNETIADVEALDSDEILSEPAEENEINVPETDNSVDIDSSTKNVDAEEESGNKKGPGLFGKLMAGLDKTRKSILGSVENVLNSFTTIDDDMFDELEEALIMADIGVETSTGIIDAVRQRVKKERINEVSAVKNIVIEEISKILSPDEEFDLKTPAVILVIGVNGVGKTTTIGKLANKYKAEGKSVILAAADTFRAAAIDQLEIWANRNDVPIIKHQENSDPAAVIFDGVTAAKNRNIDILICDTAGRLHNKKNLMEELKKINKVIEREYEQAQREVFLVLDATTGQNALQQARLFKETADITGIVLTKLDGTAKGGIVIAIKNELNIPVRYIGVGEKATDLQVFDSQLFAKALFAEEGEES